MINQTAFFCFLHLPETSPLKLTSETVHGAQMINQTAFFCFLHLPETSPLKLTSETVHGDLAMHIMLNCLLIKYYINRLRNRRHPALEGYIMHCPPPVWHLRATTTGLSDYEDYLALCRQLAW